MSKISLPFFGVKNFKSFKGEHFFHLKNITFLIGKNSSGKSSLINAIRLSRMDPTLQINDSDIGLKENWLNDKANDENVEFTKTIETGINFLNHRFYKFNQYYPESKNNNLYGQTFGKYIGVAPKSYSAPISSDSESFEYDTFTHPNEFSYYDRFQNKFLSESEFEEYYHLINEKLLERNEIIDKISNYQILSSSERKIWEAAKLKLIEEDESSKTFDGIEKSFLNYIINPYPYDFFIGYLKLIIENYDLENYDSEDKILRFNHLITEIIKKSNHIKLDSIFYFLENIDIPVLKTLFKKLKLYNDFIPLELDNPFFYFARFGPQFVNYSTDLKLNEFSYSFISIKNKVNKIDSFDLSKIQDKKFEERLNFVNKYLKFFEIGDKLEFEQTQVRGKIETEIYIVKNENRKKLFLHFGFGVQLLIPLLLDILFNESDVLLIEEPESNLHPALQSKLADFFVDLSNNFNKQVVVETHSEYIIRRMQYLVANSTFKKNLELPKVKNEDVNIYYFNDPLAITNSEDYTYEIKFKKDGGLTKQFGPGFFDVTDDIAYELFMLKNNNLN